MSDHAPAGPRPAPDAPRHRRIATLIVASGLFMEMLDGTILAVALPRMAESFGVRPVALNVGITAYLVAVAVFIPVSGWLAGRLGARRVFMAAVAGFTLASLACAASTGLPAFVAARIAQGIAGAMMTPVGRLIVLHDLPKGELVRAIALLTWPALLAPLIAPPLGGLIVEGLSWHWIFLINVPVGLVGLVLAARFMPPGGTAPGERLDIAGFLLWAGFAALLVTVVGHGAVLPRLWIVGIASATALLALLLWRHLRSGTAPLLDLSTLSVGSFRHAIIGGSLVRTAILANPFLLPLFLQVGLGYSAVEAGLLMLVGMAANVAMKPFTTAILLRLPYRRLLTINGTVLALGFAGFALVGPANRAALIALLVGTGLGRSLHFTGLNTLAFMDVAPARMRAATTLFSTVMQMNGALGVALAATAIDLSVRLGGRSGPAGLADFHAAFLAVAILCLLGALDARRLNPGDRASRC